MAINLTDDGISYLLNRLYQRYGYDFSGYSGASLRRRIARLLEIDREESVHLMADKLELDPVYALHVIEELTVNVTEMFRDASFYLCMRNVVLPVLNTWPLIRIWHAGCSTGEEVYSMAMLLKEEKLYHKSLIYATDINPGAIEKARKGIFPISQMQTYSANYIAAGGKTAFSDYYTAHYGHAKFDRALAEKMVFSTHNLVSDKSFNTFHLIICRNVLIYFDKDLQDAVIRLFNDSLESLGYLAFGAKETLRFSPVSTHFRQVEKEKIWKKK